MPDRGAEHDTQDDARAPRADAVQALIERIDALETRVAALEARDGTAHQ